MPESDGSSAIEVKPATPINLSAAANIGGAGSIVVALVKAMEIEAHWSGKSLVVLAPFITSGFIWLWPHFRSWLRWVGVRRTIRTARKTLAASKLPEPDKARFEKVLLQAELADMEHQLGALPQTLSKSESSTTSGSVIAPVLPPGQ